MGAGCPRCGVISGVCDDWCLVERAAEVAREELGEEIEALQDQLDALTKGEDLPDGTYRPSRLEALESDAEERDYFEGRYVELRDQLEQGKQIVQALISKLDKMEDPTMDQERARIWAGGPEAPII